MAEQFATQTMTKQARDQAVERELQRKYFHEARLAKHDADYTAHQADKRQHEAVDMKFQAVKASIGAKRSEVQSRIEDLNLKKDLQIETQEKSNLALLEQTTPLLQIKNRIAGMTLTQQVIGEGVKLDVLTTDVAHTKTMATLMGYKITEYVSATDLSKQLLAASGSTSAGAMKDVTQR